MEKQTTQDSQKGKFLIAVGFTSIVILFLLYSRYQDSQLIIPSVIEPIQRMAIGFYVILLISFGAISVGLCHYHIHKVKQNNKDIFSIIAIITWNNKSRKIFITTFICYGIFFSLVSGTLVYQPDVSFSQHYGAKIPSSFIAPCCGEPGYNPKIIAYLTDHVGLQIIPINLVLQIIVSYLVALNTAIMLRTYSISKRKRSMSSIGAATGLFIACPTCAGSFLSLFVGTASVIAFTIALIQLQTLFIAISIPVLVITPFIMARKLRNPKGSYVNPSKPF